MRKITRDAVEAFFNGNSFNRDNTEVIHREFNAGECLFPMVVSKLFLHGHCIATKNSDGITLSDCGWRTNTTKERLNGVLDHLGNHKLYQKNYRWYVTREDGEDYIWVNDSINYF